jgi:hypothetical protein
MRLLTFTSSLALLALCCSSTMHPLKMSTTQAVYSQSKLHLTTKVFTDDLEATLKSYPKTEKIDLVNKGIDKQALHILKQHYLENIKVYSGGKPVGINFKKAYFKDQQVEVVYIECETSNISSLNGLRFRNTLLFKIIPEQKNVINIDVAGKGTFEQTLIFENEHPPYEMELK